MAADDPLELIRRLSETYRQVRFGPGVVPKTSRAIIGLLGVWAVIAWRLSAGLVQDAMLLLAGLIATGIFVWWVRRTHEFAEKNPALALLEGSQLIEYQRFIAQQKGLPPQQAEGSTHQGTGPDGPSPDTEEPDNG